ncbi:hypothetical protein BJV82DRAFT_592363 [Fennellomyces sp. T-0311]|nr:hypothetical protein BJV82DRAFT_592363 [Fennellomyces sp. T-0311]
MYYLHNLRVNFYASHPHLLAILLNCLYVQDLSDKFRKRDQFSLLFCVLMNAKLPNSFFCLIILLFFKHVILQNNEKNCFDFKNKINLSADKDAAVVYTTEIQSCITYLVMALTRI